MAKQRKMWPLTQADVDITVSRVFEDASGSKMPQEQSTARTKLRTALQLLKDAGMDRETIEEHANSLVGKEL